MSCVSRCTKSMICIFFILRQWKRTKAMSGLRKEKLNRTHSQVEAAVAKKWDSHFTKFLF